MTAPPGEYHHHEKKAPRKYDIRMPDPNAQHYNIPDGKENIGGEGTEHKEGDHQLQEMSDDNEHKVMDQKSPSGDGNSDNYTGKSGLKGDAEKFKAACECKVIPGPRSICSDVVYSPSSNPALPRGRR